MVGKGTRDVLGLPRTQTGTHEEAFEARYARLVAGARRLGLDRAEAEDLVHDAYVLFVLARPDLTAIDNLDAYLFVIVRNLHVSSVRRAARFRSEPLSVLDYDSAELSWHDVHPLLRSERREALVRICRYALLRAPSSKAGSVLLLRYFLGFYPAEIAQLLASTPRNIDDLLIEARRQARAYLDSRRLAFHGSQAEALPLIDTADDDGPLFLERIRAAIFQRAHEPCVPMLEAVDAASAASLATCARCLDDACRRLRLPRLADRFPTDMLGPSSRSGGSGFGGGGSGASSRVRRSLRRRVTDALEHRPRELHIAVNGLPVESHRIGQETIDHTLAVVADGPLFFVEAVSDQGVRLALLNIDPFPDGALRQTVHVELSRGSGLDLSVDFSEERPTLHIVYRPAVDEPRWTEAAAEVEPAWPRIAIAPTRRDDGVVEKMRQWFAERRLRTRVVLVAIMVAAVVALGTSTGAAAVLRDAVRAVASAIEGILRPAAPVPAPPTPSPSPRAMPPASPPPLLHAVPTPHLALPRIHANAINLEIEALWKLHQVDALTGEQVSVERHGDQLLIDARVETSERRAELRRALNDVASQGAHVRVRTFEEAAAGAIPEPAAPEHATAYSVGVAVDKFPAAAILRRHFAEQFGAEEDPRVAAAVRDYAADAQETARRVALQAFALQRITRHRPPDADARVSNEARVTWRVLVREYAGAVERSAGALARHLERVFSVTDNSATREDEQDIAAMAASLDADIRKAFGSQLDASRDIESDGAALVRAARRIERGAADIRQQESP